MNGDEYSMVYLLASALQNKCMCVQVMEIVLPSNRCGKALKRLKLKQGSNLLGGIYHATLDDLCDRKRISFGSA
jgi:hypothetical protein